MTPDKILKAGGIESPRRLIRSIEETIDSLKLDLSGRTVLTEAASGYYVVTPIIASMAGARVLALTQDSEYASVDKVIAQTRALEKLCNVQNSIEIHTKRKLSLFNQADIVTNLGFVRPIDSETISAMNSDSVLPLMCEAWEFRDEDVNLLACKKKGIRVFGTNEDAKILNVFEYSGWLCLKMLFNAGIEGHKTRLLIIGTDKFGKVLHRFLSKICDNVRLLRTLREFEEDPKSNIDAVVIADYTRRDKIIGEPGDISADKFRQLYPTATVINYAGSIDIDGLQKNGVQVYPSKFATSRRMAMTLAELGPMPVIELHAAGLKASEILLEKDYSKSSHEKYAPFRELIQPLNF